MKVHLAQNENDILKCQKVILELRPHIVADGYLDKMKLVLNEGAKLVFIEENGEAVAAGVFRMNHYLARGKNIYVDDLVTSHDHRSKGYGKKILDWIKDYAIDQNCDNIHLDSGTFRHRAHKFYLNYGFDITSFHFVYNMVKM
jgi:GNAT superfamily N-acetyltransferase